MSDDVFMIPVLQTGKAAKRRREGARQRTQYDNAIKLKIIEQHFRDENPLSLHALSRKYNRPRCTLIRWKKQYQLIKIQARDRPKNKRLVAISRILPYPELEDALSKIMARNKANYDDLLI